METVVSREKCLISLPSARVRGHEAVIFICSTASSSPLRQPGLVQSNAGFISNDQFGSVSSYFISGY